MEYFLAKYDTSGSLKWIKSAGGRFETHPWTLKTDDSGSIYIAGGMLYPYINFGTTTLTNTPAYPSTNFWHVYYKI